MPSPRKFFLQSSLWGQVRVGTGVSPVQAERSSAAACGHRNYRRENFGIMLLCAVAALVSSITLLPVFLFAQSTSAPKPSSESVGVNSGGYLVHSSFEVGYRATDLTGSPNMYDTLVNLQTGPRFLDESLSMQSLNHQGTLFDNLSINSFGWGGDPNNAMRLRADKDKWYNLQSSFRRDQNFSDFDLLANPLNPPPQSPTIPWGSTPAIPAENSPHLFDTVRRMSDVDLTLLPQSRVSFRLGFTRNNMTGPSYSSVHEGTDALLLQDWNTTFNSYRFGVDLKIAPRTVLSYDQFLDYYKGDTGYQLAPFAPALLPSPGVGSVELGLPIDTANRVPCAVKAPATSLIDSTGTLTNVTCSAYFSYARNQRIRTSAPTERLSLRSNNIQRLELLASYSYSSADMTTPLDENFNGLLTRTFARAFTGTGTATANRVSNVLDVEATLHLAQHLRLIEKFNFWAYRIPQNGNFAEVDSDCTVHASCTLLTALSATAPTTTTSATQSSFNQNWKKNQTELAWDISKKLGGRVGFRYGDQTFTDFVTFSNGGENQIQVNEFTGLLGLWARPTHTLHFNFDLEHTNYDNLIFRMAPRKESRYRFQSTYTPRPWAVIGGSINILQDANADALTNYAGHNQNYGFTASLTPRQRFGLDLAYNFNSVMQNSLICFNDTPPTGVTLPFVTSATSPVNYCGNTLNSSGTEVLSSNPLLNTSYYTNHTNFGMTSVRFTPEKRVTLNLGYSITNVDGSIPQFNILQPQGSLQYKYSQPVANVSVDLGHRLAWNMGWNYYQYNEGSFVGPTAPRYFHANSVTDSLRYSF